MYRKKSEKDVNFKRQFIYLYVVRVHPFAYVCLSMYVYALYIYTIYVHETVRCKL